MPSCHPEEYQRAREVVGVWVVRVLEHKTSAQGPAHLTLTADTKRYVDRFVETIRLVNDPFERSGNLVVLPGGNPVTNLNNLLDKVSGTYGIFIPTSTQLRQKTATMCALRGTDPQVRLVSKLMTHSVSRHYEQLGSASHAAEVHKVAKGLTKSNKPPKKVTEGRRARYPFDEAETRRVNNFFGHEIEKKSVPRCRRFLQKNPNPHNRTHTR